MSISYTVQRSTKSSRIAMTVGAVIVLILALAPYWAGRGDLRMMVEIFYYLALAQMWSLLAGYGGLVSIGQQAFVGFGGYMLFALAAFGGVHPIAALFLAGIITAILAVPTALIAFRLSGAYFAIGTWVIAEVFRLSFAQFSALGGGSGMSLPASIVKSIASSRAGREHLVYWVALAIALGSILMVFLLLRSRWGLAMTAIRDSEVASVSLGVRIERIKLMTYVAVAGITSMIGALIFITKLRITPDAAFSVNEWTAFVIFIVVIGGIGTIEGPIIGTIIFFLMREYLADLGSVYLMLLGALAIVIMLVAPKGIWGYMRERFHLSLFPVGYRVKLDDEK